MGGEDGGDVDVPFSDQRDCETCLPFVEVSDNRCCRLSCNILSMIISKRARLRNIDQAYISQEPGDEVAQDNGLVGFLVTGWAWNARQIPEIRLPLVEFVIHAPSIEEQDVGIALNEPSPIEDLASLGAHRLNRSCDMLVCGLLSLDFHGGCLVRQRTD